MGRSRLWNRGGEAIASSEQVVWVAPATGNAQDFEDVATGVASEAVEQQTAAIDGKRVRLCQKFVASDADSGLLSQQVNDLLDSALEGSRALDGATSREVLPLLLEVPFGGAGEANLHGL